MSEVFVSMRKVRQKFGDQEILRGVDLDIYRGETLVLLGGSGGGKSVLMKHICGLLCPVSGTVEVDGETISCKSEREMASVRKKVSMMFQGGALFDSLTVGGNIAFPLREAGVRDEALIAERVEKALEIVRLPGQTDKMPSDLSGGMRKRVALARAVVEMPCLVLYDEPHAGLDPVTADSIDHLIKDLQKKHGMTNVVVTHEMRSVFRIADRVVFMQDGRVYFEGTPAELKASADPVLSDFIAGRSRRAAEWGE
ncbi:ABC transporter ATP-binding protein [Roseibacillus ishigakijimensis]|uniref:ATP-binding cassette domain-containing protein n=1 Tax=Roseibacillus ishigakijimensis TaxID=454146 RepID=A0A934RTJ0_9BACT|nr:ATP-binding cassette domain-containing protein [Roseibacillus ishigakijimensis]MBK1834789.1 ATP-binding cassette domain-containing protein [Roseibacillus ishigakijimensis]